MNIYITKLMISALVVFVGGCCVSIFCYYCVCKCHKLNDENGEFEQYVKQIKTGDMSKPKYFSN